MNSCPACVPETKTPKEECMERKKYNQKCNKPDEDCYNIKLSLPKEMGSYQVGQAQNGCFNFFKKKVCQGANPCVENAENQLFDLCDNEVISLANTCGEITLSKQCLQDEEKYENSKQHKKAEKLKKKMEMKKGKERYKECAKKAKLIHKKYKDREAQRIASEKDYYKRCLKLEKKKVTAAKMKAKEKRAVAKANMKRNKKKNKEKLKKLKKRLKARCSELKTRDPNVQQTESESYDSMDYEDPVAMMVAGPPCDGDLRCFSLATMGENPMYGCRGPSQVCAANQQNNQNMTAHRVEPKSGCVKCTQY